MIGKSDILSAESGKELNDREKMILNKIVHLYIVKAAPIGSRFLSKIIKDEMNLSPATLRNVMADLEDLDFISHPHTSAGRVPTDKGYRFYVDTLKNIEKLNREELKALKNNLQKIEQESILKEASKLLGTLSKYLSVVQIPQFRDLKVQKLEIVPLSDIRMLVVIDLDSNIVRTVTLEAEFEIERHQLEYLKSYINEKVSGRTLSFIHENFLDLFNDFDIKDTPLIRLFTDSLDKLFHKQSEDRVLVAGTQYLLDYPEFEDLSRVRSVIELAENEDVIVHLLDQADDSDISVMIGSEIDNEYLHDYSLVKTNYNFGNASGSIGLIGPKRMNYAKIITVVKSVSDAINKSLRND